MNLYEIMEFNYIFENTPNIDSNIRNHFPPPKLDEKIYTTTVNMKVQATARKFSLASRLDKRGYKGISFAFIVVHKLDQPNATDVC